jgi:hypothetical protein
VKKEHQWILGSGRGSFIAARGNCGVGPGSYEEGHHRHELRTNWGKSERFHYSHTDGSVVDLPGPGSYNSKIVHSKSDASSIFKSKSQRTRVESIASAEFNVKKKRREQLFDNPEASYIGPSSNRLSELKNSRTVKKTPKAPAFASRIPRFLSSSPKQLS